MKWIKKGLIYCSKGEYDWNKSHAQIPIVDKLDKERLRIYYSTRDISNRSHISFIDVESTNPQNILYKHNKPILELGKQGTFDDSGQMPTCIVNVNNKKYLYYIGWNIGVTVPYHNSIGLAVANDNYSDFRKISEGPIIDRSPIDSYFTGTAFILSKNDLWRMWYLSCTKWEMINGKLEPFYHIKYAESKDGINWYREGKVAIDYKYDSEAGICSASVIEENGIYKMWYSYRFSKEYRSDKRTSYRIGYAESIDGIIWNRKDSEFLFRDDNNDNNDWDSIMLAYPNVIKINESKYMFYNGNGFGKTGFGYAVLGNT